MRGGEGGQSAMGTLEMVRSSCLLRIKEQQPYFISITVLLLQHVSHLPLSYAPLFTE